jgi:hypothetical protein
MGSDFQDFVNALNVAVSAKLIEQDQAKRLLTYYIEKVVNYSVKEDKEAKGTKEVK